MNILRERTYRTVHDIIRMPEVLNNIAREHEAQGYEVQRGFAGTVILKLQDGEIRFVPNGNRVVEMVMEVDDDVED